MVEYNQAQRTVKVKIAYYGPALGGKTTNLKVLHERARPEQRSDLVSVNSEQDRTILCDLLPLRTGGFRGFDLRLQLLAVPGQTTYAAPRRAVLKGSDGVVFVGNSAVDRWHENLQSFQELEANLRVNDVDPGTIPLVFQYNKRDLPQVLEVSALNRGLNARGVPAIEAVARLGKGVLETFSAIVSLTLENLTRRYRMMRLAEGQTVEAWTAQALRDIFGRDRFDETPAEEPPIEIELGSLTAAAPSSQHLKVRIAMPEERKPAGAGSEVRSAESLVESYAEASAELGLVVSELREERDKARARMSEVRAALALNEQGAAHADLEGRAARVLKILQRSAGASNAALVLTVSGAPQIQLLPPLVADPLSRTHWGAKRLEELRVQREPLLESASETPELAEVFQASEPCFEAVVVAPLRSAERLVGLALLYFLPHVALPSEETLLHLGLLARVLAGALEATAAREAAAGTSRLRALSQASVTAVASLMARLPPTALRRQPVRLEDVVGPLKAPGVVVAVHPGTPPLLADAPLLRFAIATLVHRCEAAALDAGRSPRVMVWAGLEHGVLRVKVTGGDGAAAGASQADADAETNAVRTIVALHDGMFLPPEAEGPDVQFTIQFKKPA
jgi:mutual gliding-motility protein MglA